MDWQQWLESETAAAWFQAVAAGAAIVIAVAVPLVERTLDHRERRRMARARSGSLALTLLPVVESYYSGLLQAQQGLRAAEVQRIVEAASWVDDGQRAMLTLRNAFVLPADLVAAIASFPDLGPVAQPLQEIVHQQRMAGVPNWRLDDPDLVDFVRGGGHRHIQGWMTEVELVVINLRDTCRQLRSWTHECVGTDPLRRVRNGIRW